MKGESSGFHSLSRFRESMAGRNQSPGAHDAYLYECIQKLCINPVSFFQVLLHWVRSMRPTLKEELEYALWKITGTPLQFNEHSISYLSQEIAKKTGEDPAIVGLRLVEEIKRIINEDLDRQIRRRKPCEPAGSL
jgi:hypothetical protein